MGYACKRTPFIPDWLIIWILIVGIFAACTLYGWTISSIVDGIMSTGMAVFCHQMVKQTFSRVKKR
ncbi:phage holin family protein [Gracilibacillus sp. HCP3S3_G5_1]|uniref:phage holin family protein n=1 Tax=unclassified Gracilibacillus TaxID=2625209 RepID=UPI003F8BE18B